MIQIDAVGQNGAVPESFLALPGTLYAGQRCWTPRPVENTVKLLDTAYSPYWKQAERELFIAVSDGKIVGRIAVTDDRTVSREDGAGYFGFFEAIDDQAVADALLACAAHWLRVRGRRVMRGPFSPSPYIYDLGLLVDGFDRPQSFSEPYHPPYYQRLLESRGLKKIVDYLSIDLPGRAPAGVLKDRVRQRLQASSALHVRRFDSSRIESDLDIATQILNAEYGSDAIYSADPVDVGRFALNSLAPFDDWSLCFIAEVDGETAGIMIASPDYDDGYRRSAGCGQRPSALQPPGTARGACIVELAVVSEFQHTQAATALLYAFWDAVAARDYEYNKACFVEDDNQACLPLTNAFGGVPSKRLRIYETALSTLA